MNKSHAVIAVTKGICHNVDKSIMNDIKDSAKQAHVAFDNYKSDNPLLMRKKFGIKDVYYRRDNPEEELFRFELAFDVEQYVLISAAVCLVILIALKIARCAGHMKEKRAYRRMRKTAK